MRKKFLVIEIVVSHLIEAEMTSLRRRKESTGRERDKERGPSIYDVHTEGGGWVRLRWTHVDGGREVNPHVDVHTES